MNTPRPPDRHDPLTRDERALAERLVRLGPHEGPSAAMDARILAAAHRAVAASARTRRGWRGWLAAPGALVTAVGSAATLALAIGVVWQLRPQADGAPVPREAAASPEETTVVFDSVPAPARPMVMPAPPPAAPAAVESAPSARVAAQMRDDAASSAKRPGSAASTAAAQAAAGTAVAAPPAESADAAMPALARESATDRAAAAPAFVPDPVARPAAEPASTSRASRANYTTAARARAERAERRDASVLPAQPAVKTTALKANAPQADAQTAGASAAEAGAQAEAERTTLDRVEVTGSRVRATLPPLHEDSALTPSEWLQRIRDRRDAGELDDARASLAQFRKAHPRVRLPDDLRALAP